MSTPTFGPAASVSSRRELLQAAFTSAVAMVAATRMPHAARAADPGEKRTGLLTRPSALDTLQTRSKVVLELSGQLQIVEPDPKKKKQIRTAEVKSKSTLDYFEKIAFDSDRASVAARRYVTAKGENWVAGSASSQELRTQCAETRMMFHSGIWQQYCSVQPLDAREVELLHSPINTMVLEQLLPAEPAKANQAWDITAESCKNLFNLEAVHSSNLTAKIVKVENGIATAEFSGNLDATIHSVSTKLAINGNFQAKLASQGALVSWLGMVIKENRAISQAEPGFSVTARISLIRAESDQDLAVPEQELLALATAEDPGRWLIQLRSLPGHYQMLADRRWTTYIDGGEEAILRLIENNTVISQCNIRQLPKLDAGTQLTLEALQAEIKNARGEVYRELLESSEKLTSSGLRLLRLVVTGELEGVPIQWIYAHLSDDQGRRLIMEFTMSAGNAERFAAADEQMTASFEFIAVPTNSETPTPAAQLSAKPEDESKRDAKAETRVRHASDIGSTLKQRCGPWIALGP